MIRFLYIRISKIVPFYRNATFASYSGINPGFCHWRLCVLQSYISFEWVVFLFLILKLSNKKKILNIIALLCSELPVGNAKGSRLIACSLIPLRTLVCLKKLSEYRPDSFHLLKNHPPCPDLRKRYGVSETVLGKLFAEVATFFIDDGWRFCRRFTSFRFLLIVRLLILLLFSCPNDSQDGNFGTFFENLAFQRVDVKLPCIASMSSNR